MYSIEFRWQILQNKIAPSSGSKLKFQWAPSPNTSTVLLSHDPGVHIHFQCFISPAFDMLLNQHYSPGRARNLCSSSYNFEFSCIIPTSVQFSLFFFYLILNFKASSIFPYNPTLTNKLHWSILYLP